MGTVQNLISRIHIPALSLSTERLLLLILAILILSFLINYFLSHSFLGASYRVFVAPGIILHELAHMFFCLITGAHMTKVSFFDKDGGSVEHKPSKVPILGPILISIAPFVAGAIAIYFLSRRLGLREVDFSAFSLSLVSMKSIVLASVHSINYHDYRNLIIVYLVTSIAVTMTPSAQDLKNMFFSLLVAIILVILAVDLLGNRFTLPALTVPVAIPLLLSTVVVILILSLILSMIVYAISKMIRPTV